MMQDGKSYQNEIGNVEKIVKDRLSEFGEKV
jgi:hypothetical protein